MHALHLPFTGIFVGGFAIIIISLLASLPDATAGDRQSVFSRIAKATILVLLVKAAVSPQSPPPAYIAVAFQGFLGAVLFRWLPFKAAAILLGIIAMAESALQRIAIATLIYGKSIWQALDTAFNSIVNDLHLPADVSFSVWLIVGYAGLYAIWGLLLGIWMIKLPSKLQEFAATLYANDDQLPMKIAPSTRRKGKHGKLLMLLVVLLFIVVVLLLDRSSISRAAYVVIRTLAVVGLLVWVVNPLFGWAMARWVKQARGDRARSLKEVVSVLPELRGYVAPAYENARKQKSWLSKFRVFVLTLLVLTLYSPVAEAVAIQQEDKTTDI